MGVNGAQGTAASHCRIRPSVRPNAGAPEELAKVKATGATGQFDKAAQIFDQWFGAHSDLKMKRAFTFAPYKQP